MSRPGGATVVVVGALNVDLVVAADRLPGPGETVVGAGLERHGGGKGANAAVAAARAGAQVHLVAAVGTDDDGRAAVRELEAEGVDCGAVLACDGVATGAALIVVDAHGENQIAVGAGANGVLPADHVRTALADLVARAGCVLVSTEIPGPAVTAAVEAALAAGVPCVLNPAPVTPEVVALVARGAILTPNAGECRSLVAALGGPEPGGGGRQAAEVSAQALAGAAGAPVVVTLGGDGVLVVVAGDTHRLPAAAVDVRDTTGAGDTFNGILAVGLAAGTPLQEAAAVACTGAGLSVGRVGARAGMPTATALAQARPAAQG